MPHFDALKIFSCGKHCEKRRNCLFSQRFLPYMTLIFHLKCTSKCRLQFVSNWTSLKCCRLVMVTFFNGEHDDHSNLSMFFLGRPIISAQASVSHWQPLNSSRCARLVHVSRYKMRVLTHSPKSQTLRFYEHLNFSATPSFPSIPTFPFP